ncbi:MAG: HEPN domain-containing protein [Acidobacteriota bacterium]
MTNIEEVRRRIKEAEECLRRAERNIALKDHVVVVQNSQLTIELCAKSIISYFEEPIWSHNPSDQLLKVIKRLKTKTTGKADLFYKEINELAKYVKEAAPWHAWSTYSRETEKGWQSTSELCTEIIAKELLFKANKSYEITKKVISLFGIKD